MLKKLAIVALLLAFTAAPLWADEVSGKIQKVDTSDRSIVLEDGTQLWLAESVSADDLKEGATVKASYEEKDGKKVVTEIQVSQSRWDAIGHAGRRRARSSAGGEGFELGAGQEPADRLRRDHDGLAGDGNLHDSIRRVASRDLRRPVALDHADQLAGLGVEDSRAARAVAHRGVHQAHRALGRIRLAARADLTDRSARQRHLAASRERDNPHVVSEVGDLALPGGRQHKIRDEEEG
jgi:hypothetical protein